MSLKKIALSLAALVLVASGIGATFAGLVYLEDGYLGVSSVDKAPSRMGELSQAIWNDINNTEMTVRNVRGTIILEGLADDLREKMRAQEIAETYARGYLPLIPRQVKVLNLIIERSDTAHKTASN